MALALNNIRLEPSLPNTISLLVSNTIILGEKVTILGLGAFSRPPYASFAGKPAAPANEEIEQSRSIMRFVYSRVFGRVN